MQGYTEAKSSQNRDTLNDLYRYCLREFRLLAIDLERDLCPAVQSGYVDVAHLADEYARFKLWGEQTRADLPAEARGSLDDTLRGESGVQALISSILSILQAVLKQAIPLLKRTDDEDDDSSDGESSDDNSVNSAEIRQSPERNMQKDASERIPRVTHLLREAGEQIALLFRFSNLLTRSTVTGRWIRSAVKTESALNELSIHIDRLYVEDKICSWRGLGKETTAILTEEEDVAAYDEEKTGQLPWLHHRLSQANTRRRAQLRYWASHPYHSIGTRHNSPMEEAPPPNQGHAIASTRSAGEADTKVALSVKSRTITSSQQQSQPSATTKQTFSTVAASDARDELTNPDRPQTVYAESALGTQRGKRVPAAPGANEDGKFSCPYCGIELPAQTVNERSKWKRHIFRDLRPYVCTFENCPTPERRYLSRTDWIHHEWQVHRRRFSCDECNVSFGNRQSMAEHLADIHGDILRNERQISFAVDLCERPADEESTQICVICGDEMSLINLQIHLASHMEALALFVLPLDMADEDVVSNESNRVLVEEITLELSDSRVAFDDQPDFDHVQASSAADTPPAMPSSHVGHKKLADQIVKTILFTNDGKQFVPANAIAALSTRDKVEHELKGIVDPSSLQSLVEYVLTKPAAKIFLTLAYRSCLDAIVHFYRLDIGDKDLPIKFHDASSLDSARPSNDGQVITSSARNSWASPPAWEDMHRFDFISDQWRFLAPVFVKETFTYHLDQQCPLPIILKKPNTRGGLAGSVNEVEIHHAHQKVLDQTDGKPIRIALKLMRPQMGHYFTQELKTLEVIRTIDNPHLIKPIAAFQLHNEENGGFLFPWAEGGNMRDFWSMETLRPHNSPEMMRWVVKQMSGLCHALKILHAGGHRHGDLKPENILLFHEGGYKGTLRIADLGLAKFHENPTEQRKNLMRITQTNTGTMLYVSPEFFHAEQIPRVFDVWSLGCIYVEFLIWILYGNGQLDQFRKARFDHFWEVSGDEFLVHSNVRSLLDRLSEDLKGPETALGEVLQVVKRQMLVPDFGKRSTSHDVYDSLARILARAAEEPEYLINPAIWSRISTKPQPFTTSLEQNLAPSSASLRRLSPLEDPQNSQLTHGNREAPQIRAEDTDDHDSSGALTVPSTARIARDYMS